MDTKKSYTLEDEFFEAGWISGIVVLVLAFLYWFFLARHSISVPCIFHEFFHLYCPGCGGTRATIYLLQGRFLTSLWYHPVVLYTAIIYVLFMSTQTIQRLTKGRVKGIHFHMWYIWGAVIILAGNFIIKNILLICFHITMK